MRLRVVCSVAVVASAMACERPNSNGTAADLQADVTALTARYVCRGHEDILFTAVFDGSTDPPSAVLRFGDREASVVGVPTGSGSRYQGPDVDFWEHQGEVRLTWSGTDYVCDVQR